MRGWQNVVSFFSVKIGGTARAQLSKDQSIQIKGVRRACRENPFRTIETALFESKLSQDTLSSGETIGAGNQIFTINLNNFVN